MQPQPYFPEGEELPGNAAGLDYDVRLAFIRRVVDLYAISMVVVVGATLGFLHFAPDYSRDITRASLAVLGALLVASTLRKIRMGGAPDRLSIWVLPFILGTFGRLGAALTQAGWRLELIPVAVAAMWLYRMLCGRDFSFLGMFTLSVIPVALTGAILRVGSLMMLLGLAALAYLVYDLAALLQRRRLGEAGLAVVDLYRDVLNFISYTFRVIHHWRNFRI